MEYAVGTGPAPEDLPACTALKQTIADVSRPATIHRCRNRTARMEISFLLVGPTENLAMEQATPRRFVELDRRMHPYHHSCDKRMRGGSEFRRESAKRPENDRENAPSGRRDVPGTLLGETAR